MKSPLLRLFAPTLAFILIFLSACDTGGGEESSILRNSTQNFSFALGNKSLSIVNNILSDENHIRIDGHDTVTVVKVRVTKYGRGGTEEVADNVLRNVSVVPRSSVFEETLIIDSVSPVGAYTVTTITMPRKASLKIIDKQGKHEIYNVDGRLDLNVWKGWMTVLSATENLRSYMDYGDMILNLQHCKENGLLDAKMEAEGSIIITVPRLLNAPQPTQAILTAENKNGSPEIDGLTLLNRSDTNIGTTGMKITGGIDRGNGIYNVFVNKGILRLRAWAGVTKN